MFLSPLHREATVKELCYLVEDLLRKNQFWAAENIMQLCFECIVEESMIQETLFPYLQTYEPTKDAYAKLAEIGFLQCICEGLLRRDEMNTRLWFEASDRLSEFQRTLRKSIQIYR